MGTSNKQIAHKWAAQQRTKGTGSNFYFEGPTIFSYGPHFPIAKFHAHPNDPRVSVVLFTTHTRSISTSRHLHYARWAIPDNKQIFNVPNVWPSGEREHIENFVDYKTRVADLLIRASRARSNKAHLLESARETIAEGNSYRATFGLFDTVAIVDDISEERIAEAGRISREARAKAAEARTKRDAEWQAASARREAERVERDAQRAVEWLAGKNVYPPESGETLLRVKGEEIETSRGAKVPVSVAPYLWNVIQHTRKVGADVRYNDGQRIGDFELREVTRDGDLVVGCHRLNYSELARIAQTLGLKAA